MKQCIQFYYLWKKVCPDDYKRLRIYRRKREQAGYYAFRSTTVEPPPVPPSDVPSSNGLDNGHDVDSSEDDEVTSGECLS